MLFVLNPVSTRFMYVFCSRFPFVCIAHTLPRHCRIKLIYNSIFESVPSASLRSHVVSLSIGNVPNGKKKFDNPCIGVMSVNLIFEPDRTYAFCSYSFQRFYFINPRNGFRTIMTAIRAKRVWKSHSQFDVRIGADRLCGT